ncbi:MAG: hypothetical protein ACP5L1_06595, partial [Caldivirga sp.]
MGWRLVLVVGFLALILMIIGVAYPWFSIEQSGGVFKAVNNAYGLIEYFNYSSSGSPTLVIRGLFRGMPVNFTVSLFAIEPMSINTVGYFRGFGVASVSLLNGVVLNASFNWLNLFHGGIEPSLLA